MNGYPQKNSNVSIDLGLPLEAEVLSQFFDHDYNAVEYINALVAASLNSSDNQKSNNSISIRKNELNSDVSLKVFSQRCLALSTHLNEYTNELTKRFDQSYERLVNSSNQIISYNKSSNNRSSVEDVNNESDDIETRLQYHLATLNSAMYLLLEDLNQTKEKLNKVKVSESNDSKITELKTLMDSQAEINKVLKSYDLLKSIVESSTDVENLNSPNSSSESSDKNNKIKLEDFKKAVAVLRNLVKDQIENEIQLVTNSTDDEKIQINDKLLKIIDNMINLQPIFKSLIYFQTVYSSFVDFLKIERSRYVDLFDNSIDN